MDNLGVALPGPEAAAAEARIVMLRDEGADIAHEQRVRLRRAPHLFYQVHAGVRPKGFRHLTRTAFPTTTFFGRFTPTIPSS